MELTRREVVDRILDRHLQATYMYQSWDEKNWSEMVDAIIAIPQTAPDPNAPRWCKDIFWDTHTKRYWAEGTGERIGRHDAFCRWCGTPRPQEPAS